jgi:hypothetical protein
LIMSWNTLAPYSPCRCTSSAIRSGKKGVAAFRKYLKRLDALK